MDARLCMLLLEMFLQLYMTQSAHVSGTITENTTFFYRKLPVAPSVRATIEFSISYLQQNTNPSLGIYTTYPKLNVEKRCSYQQHGQLRNENLYPHLRPGRRYRTTSCGLSGDHTVGCRGRVEVQDYIPRTFYLTFGFDCNLTPMYSLNGLSCNISFTKQSNATNDCTDYSQFPNTGACSRFYNETSVPNLIGDEQVEQIFSFFKRFLPFEALFFQAGTCYQHMWEFACYTILPKCDPVMAQVMHPCREMCWDVVSSCWPKWLHLLSGIDSDSRYKSYNVDFMYLLNMSHLINCDYLPFFNGSIPCFYKPVTCGSPPDVTDGIVMVNVTEKDVYQLHDVVQYACVDNSFEMVGNDSLTCLYSGKWSDPPPKCVHQRKNTSLHVLHIVLPILMFPLVALFIILIILKVKSKTIYLLSRAREFDALVCYKFDTDNDYVINKIMNSLEQICEPPLKLCVHERDFLPGLHIKDNIKDAITKSNSAIIVMSQAFIDSVWCQEEFAHCYLENMHDPTFRIFLIMMQPAEHLDNLSEYMRSFMESRTYLSKYDPKLFHKIASYLAWVKMPKCEKNRDPPKIELNEHDIDIEVEFVPSDPFLFVANDYDADKYDQTTRFQENAIKKENIQTHQIKAEVHHNAGL